MNYLTLAEENQATITCPIFNTQTKFASCLKLRDRFWRGERTAVRAGCQACMRSGKCPVAHIVQSIAMAPRSSPQPDEYGSLTPAEIKLRFEHLDRIAPVMMSPAAIQEFRPSPAEMSLIESANDRIQKAMSTAPRTNPKSTPRFTPSETPRRRPVEKPAPVDNALAKAAATGDLAAAIS